MFLILSKRYKKLLEVLGFKQLIKEIPENNIMLRQIIKVINTWFAHHNQENDNDFNRNVMANLVSNIFDFNKIFKR